MKSRTWTRGPLGRLLLIACALVTAHTSVAGRRSTLDEIPFPGGRQPTAGEIELGRALFFDARLSSNDAISCATCHQPEHGFADPRALSVGVAGTPLKRHTPHLYNLAWARTLFWDGRASSLEEQALAPIRNPEEMGLAGDAAAEKLRRLPE